MDRMKKRAFFLSVAMLALSAGAALAQPAAPVSADDPPPPQPPPGGTDAANVARNRYNAGVKAFEQKRFVEAALFFEAAAADKPHAVALYTAALAWEQANQPDRAADDYVRCIAVQGLALDKLMLAKERLGQLQSVLGRIEVTGPEGFRVQLDGYTELGVPAVLHGSAGVHVLHVRAPDRPAEDRSLYLQIGSVQKVELSAAAPEGGKDDKSRPAPIVVAAPSSEAPRGPDVRRTIGFIALGLGGAALLSGTILGVSALDAKDAYIAAPTQNGLDHANSLQTWTNVTFVAGAVLAVGGALLVLWPSSSPSPASKTGVFFSPGLGGASLRGAF
jgi:hypothetical protein